MFFLKFWKKRYRTSINKIYTICCTNIYFAISRLIMQIPISKFFRKMKSLKGSSVSCRVKLTNRSSTYAFCRRRVSRSWPICRTRTLRWASTWISTTLPSSRPASATSQTHSECPKGKHTIPIFEKSYLWDAEVSPSSLLFNISFNMWIFFLPVMRCHISYLNEVTSLEGSTIPWNIKLFIW